MRQVLTWRRDLDEGAMDASVKRHDEEHVRQVGSDDPEQRGGSHEVDKSDTQSDY